MVRFEKDKYVIEVPSSFPTEDWKQLMTDILSAIGSIDPQLLEGEHDSVFGLTRFLLQMLPEEDVVKKIVEESKKQ